MDIEGSGYQLQAHFGPQPGADWQATASDDGRHSRLKIHSLGRFSVQLDREALLGKVKARHQRPLELLQALVAFGGRGVHAELLCQALWPDTEGDKAQNAFDVTLHRLRKLLELKDLILVDDRHVTLNGVLAWVDIWAFERTVNHGERLLRRLDEPAASAQLLDCEDRLLALYQGSFLEREATRPSGHCPYVSACAASCCGT